MIDLKGAPLSEKPGSRRDREPGLLYRVETEEHFEQLSSPFGLELSER